MTNDPRQFPSDVAKLNEPIRRKLGPHEWPTIPNGGMDELDRLVAQMDVDMKRAAEMGEVIGKILK